MNSKSKIKKVFITALAAFTLVPLTALAAEIHINAANRELMIGEQFASDVLLNTDYGINALEGHVAFPSDLLELIEVRDGDSIINFWLERPRFDSPGKIIFSGITPGGFEGNNGLLFSIIFSTKQSGTGAITLENVKALKNDGAGTPAELSIPSLRFSISKEVSAVMPMKKEDSEPPETFVPEIAHNQDIFDDQWFLVFATQDKNSGIDHYEVKETRQRFFSIFDKWVAARSPYVLMDQELKSFVFVKAVDRARNSIIVKIEPLNPPRWYENYVNWIIVIGGTAAGLFIIRKSWLRKNM